MVGCGWICYNTTKLLKVEGVVSFLMVVYSVCSLMVVGKKDSNLISEILPLIMTHKISLSIYRYFIFQKVNQI